MDDFRGVRLAGIAGQAGAGKDTFYEHVLKPGGFLRWQMTLHYKTWLVGTGRASFEEVFVTKPPHVRKILQEEITALRYEWSEFIWLDVFKAWLVSMREIVGVDVSRVAVTDLRFLVEMRGIKEMGGKIVHIEACDQQANMAPDLRGHRSETEMQSPEVKMLRDSYVFNDKRSFDELSRQGYCVLHDWGWL